MPDDMGKNDTTPSTVPEKARDDIAERPGSDNADKQHEDELVDEWEEESFPASDPPGHY